MEVIVIILIRVGVIAVDILIQDTIIYKVLNQDITHLNQVLIYIQQFILPTVLSAIILLLNSNMGMMDSLNQKKRRSV
ncbi:uncharacterized protein SPAPADRAFT_61126 [Spathaspora passalidarum NRRL Y-27907]|uniref:Uncharacterized protein n=1 Tax=Spathaspora passalidarum (strain NRRL Y-27907 / 11-Y1) TaxID=619300 RepID=G3ANT8_SPAPN|nr:uncharacterized protein SPAPADRAFT_61126 [Spathaspora passalidarum NRRL Y-27907]EGW32023.1 hypothetical protein SPAPADRAFT_61126 [Spathaspora passalidarum NRRL Y-27907]